MKIIQRNNNPPTRIWAGQYVCKSYDLNKPGCGSIIQIDDDLDVTVYPDFSLDKSSEPKAGFACPHCLALNEVELEDKLKNLLPYKKPSLWQQIKKIFIDL